jgi:hypothetical protein
MANKREPKRARADQADQNSQPKDSTKERSTNVAAMSAERERRMTPNGEAQDEADSELQLASDEPQPEMPQGGSGQRNPQEQGSFR